MHPTDMKLVGSQHSYTAGGNVSWINPFWSPCTVPVIESAVTLLAMGKFKEPVPIQMTVAVNSKSDPRKQEHRMQSLLRRISPEEEHLAYVLATYRDVSAGLSIQDNLLCQWTAIFLNLALPPQEKQSASIYTPNVSISPRFGLGSGCLFSMPKNRHEDLTLMHPLALLSMKRNGRMRGFLPALLGRALVMIWSPLSGNLQTFENLWARPMKTSTTPQ